MADLPIVCTLTAEALKARKDGLLARIAGLSTHRVNIAAGYRFEFAPDAETLHLIADMIDSERLCCRFLRFALIVEADSGPIQLEVTGPPGTREFLSAFLESR